MRATEPPSSNQRLPAIWAWESLPGAKGYTTIRLAALKNGLHKGFDERSGAHNFAGGCRGGERAGAGGGGRLSLGFLVSGGAEREDSREPAGYGDVAGGAAGFGADCGGAGVCHAGFLPAPGDATFLWAFRWGDGRVQLSRMAV